MSITAANELKLLASGDEARVLFTSLRARMTLPQRVVHPQYQHGKGQVPVPKRFLEARKAVPPGGS